MTNYRCMVTFLYYRHVDVTVKNKKEVEKKLNEMFGKNPAYYNIKIIKKKGK